MHKPSTVMSSISSFESIGNESFPNEPSQTPVPPRPFDIYAAYQRFLRDEEISTPLAAILALTELIEESTGESQPARMAVKQ
ncbi:hypothetical protein FIBSPDRAFT_522122 [Athelia psychrophila]|uniref:Uncharacterized protein n=1 Tax=Athelia psychrophila TaxID=1759441 RepID=A0A167TL31_9AGAM|nr:hypothetical protein FIBSPDRAFT_522122 [Fibularhizoctonia sp. CBS 109695]